MPCPIFSTTRRRLQDPAEWRPYIARLARPGCHLPGQPIQDIPRNSFDGFISAAQAVRPVGGADGHHRPAGV